MIDDATSKIFARFYDSDSTVSNMDIIKRYINRYGAPMSIYTDKASHFKVNKGEKREDVLSPYDKSKTWDRKSPGGVRDSSYSRSQPPPRKGRIERLNSTLQDRLVKLLRYEGITEIDAANSYLNATYLEYHNKSSR
jgi:hypothetical protein